MHNRLVAKRITGKTRASRFVNFSCERSPDVGEVRAVVRLTNAADATLLKRKKLKRQKVRTVVEDAMVDTGAVRIVIPEEVFKKLGLQVLTHRVVELADGQTQAVRMTEPVVIELEGRITAEEAVVMGNEVLIGQTVLESLDLYVDCKRRRLVPNPAHPDEAVTKVK
jgi:clan AA aspartic protease